MDERITLTDHTADCVSFIGRACDCDGERVEYVLAAEVEQIRAEWCACSRAEVEQLKETLAGIKEAAHRSEIGWLRGYILGRLAYFHPAEVSSG